MFEYEADPKHPDAHPLYDDSKVQETVYDPSELTPEQIKFEERRARRKACKKARRLAAEAEELKRNGGIIEKIHKHYAPKNALITPHDFDGIPEHCTECSAPLWGTKFVLPLWRRKSRFSNQFLTDPFCDGCNRLFNTKWCKTLADKYEIIKWIMTGEASNLDGDIDITERDYSSIHNSMTKRARRMRKATPLYDRHNWTFLKREEELIYEYSHIYPDDNHKSIRNIVDRFLRYDKEVYEVPTKHQIDVASSDELYQLVQAREGRDALLSHKCLIANSKAFNGLTFDHLEPCSHERYTDGSYSIGNIQLLSSCLNAVKGHYSERELVRWLVRLLECYEERYGGDKD